MRVELDNVSLTYQPGTTLEATALDGIDLKLEQGERLGICGATGSGKSTLLGVMAGILAPTGGTVIHDGRSLSRRERPRAGSIGLSLQSPENCLFEKTVFDDIAFAPRRQGLEGERLAGRVTEAMKQVGLEPLRYGKRSPFSLSTGEQRRVALAGVISPGPDILLLDEPTAYLDPASRGDLLQRLIDLNIERKTTLAIVGHDMDEMAVFAERLVVIAAGRVAADGPAAELLADSSLLREHNLEPPATVELCERLGGCLGREVPPVLTEQEAEELLRSLFGSRGVG